jgi:hypothetical protein
MLTKDMSNRRFKFLFSVHQKHKFFEDREHPGRIAVADRSGWFPNQTDDGVLWLDRDRIITRFGDPDDERWHLPLFDDKGRKLFTPCTLRETDEVRRAFKMEQDFTYAYQCAES